jgi:hypothetical protein
VTVEWIRRNPKAAAGLSGLAVLCAVILVWGMSGGSRSASADPTLGGPSLAVPTITPHRAPLTGLASPSGTPTSMAGGMAGFSSSGFSSSGSSAGSGLGGPGFHDGLPPHHIVISAGSDGPLLGVGWKMPTADGPRSGKDLSGRRTFRYSTTVYGKPDYAQLYTYDGPESSTIWCTITVDGKVTEHQVAKGPWGQVFCQG